MRTLFSGRPLPIPLQVVENPPSGVKRKRSNSMSAIRRHVFGHRAVKSVLALILALGIWLPACAAQDQTKGGKPADAQGALARVNGKDVNEADIKAFAADQFAQLEKQYEQQKRELLEGALEQTIQDRLLEAEAAARGVSKEQVLADLKPAAVTDPDIDAFYEQNKAQ